MKIGVVVQSRAWAEELAAATADARERVADCDIAADALARIARGRNPDGILSPTSPHPSSPSSAFHFPRPLPTTPPA